MRKWTWNDGWLLAAMSLVQKNGGATLAEVIGAADAIHHVIPTAGQLSRAFSQLVACGVVQIENEQYLVAADQLVVIREALHGKGGLFSSADKCLRWLKNANLESGTSAPVKVSESEVAAAFESYCKALKKRK